MNVTATNEPCMILETVELLYAFVNELPAGELTAPGPYTIPSSELQHMLASATEGISRQDPAMQFFFLKEPLQDGSGLFTCLARAVVYNTMDFSCKTLGASFDSLRRNWQELRQRGEHISAIGEFGMDYMEQEDRSFVPLSVDLERLEVTPEYRQSSWRCFPDLRHIPPFLRRCWSPLLPGWRRCCVPGLCGQSPWPGAGRHVIEREMLLKFCRNGHAAMQEAPCRRYSSICVIYSPRQPPVCWMTKPGRCFFTPAWPRRQSERNRWILRTGNTMRCGSWEVLHG